MLYSTRSTVLCPKNNKRRKWNSSHLKLKTSETAISQALLLQINLLELPLKLCAKSNGWNHLNMLQFPNSINMRMYMNCSNSWGMAPKNEWFLISEAWGSRICNNIWGLCGEKSNSIERKFWRDSWVLIWKWLLWQLWLGFSYLYFLLITLIIILTSY